MQRGVILLSGGVDSATLLQYMKQELGVVEIHALSFLYGQRHARELEAARWQAERAGVGEHHVVDMSFMGALTRGGSALTDPDLSVPNLADVPEAERSQPPTYVPNRNMVFLSLGAAYAESVGIRDLYYGAQAQDDYGYWDCTAPFVERINGLLSLNRREAVEIHAPFLNKRKAEVVKIGLALGVDYAHTWTCYRGGETPCGTCPSCEERRKAFAEAAGER
jgi:7-cyano-7-deazaguanine synthase